ncbi:MAG: hypothetical protein VW397_07035 [Candidatus Margulisiibacteriota bacterium]|jgi:polysaccharide pyruvyl transferase WcaK-like protein
MRVILFGYYGFGNIGDERLLDETVKLIQSNSVVLSYVVANGPNPAPFPTFNRWNPFAWVYQLYRANAIVFGGGSLFQSKSGFMSLCFYLAVVGLARILNCQIILLCHGWGPFKFAWHEQLTRWFLSNSKRSWRTLRPPFNDDVILTDLTLIQPMPNPTDLPKTTIALMLRSPNDLTQISNALRDHCPILIMETQLSPHSSALYLGDVWESHQLPLKGMVTDRFHGAIWAIRHGIPWLSISDDSKLIDLAVQTGARNYLTLNDAMTDLLAWEARVEGGSLDWAKKQQSKYLDVKGWLNEQLTH